MPAAVVIGSQWGDEGKGKVVDVFSSQADYVVRYQGGANAGHTLKLKDSEVILHLVPSGILHAQVTCVIACGVALDVVALCKEIQALQSVGLMQSHKQLLISDSATLLLKSHQKLDQAREAFASFEKIGTTGKGIGPAYESRAERKALLFADLFESETFLREKIFKSLQEKNFLLEHFYKKEPVSVDAVLSELLKAKAILKPYRCKDTSLKIHQALQQNKRVLFEGAQGSLLDLWHGTYPYVTSSSTLAGGALTHCGVGVQAINKVMAITKAYTTRVGSGPFPTECSDTKEGHYLQEKGLEFGATTGRKRRCGWLDLVALRYAIRINGISHLSLMKLDVLSGLKEIKVCTHYEQDGKRISDFPNLSRSLKSVKAQYKIFSGWQEDLSHIRSKKDLPTQAIQYVDFISKELNTPIDVISVGSKREETIWIQPLFLDSKAPL